MWKAAAAPCSSRPEGKSLLVDTGWPGQLRPAAVARRRPEQRRPHRGRGQEAGREQDRLSDHHPLSHGSCRRGGGSGQAHPDRHLHRSWRQCRASAAGREGSIRSCRAARRTCSIPNIWRLIKGHQPYRRQAGPGDPDGLDDRHHRVQRWRGLVQAAAGRGRSPIAACDTRAKQKHQGRWRRGEYPLGRLAAHLRQGAHRRLRRSELEEGT